MEAADGDGQEITCPLCGQADACSRQCDLPGVIRPPFFADLGPEVRRGRTTQLNPGKTSMEIVQPICHCRYVLVREAAKKLFCADSGKSATRPYESPPDCGRSVAKRLKFWGCHATKIPVRCRRQVQDAYDIGSLFPCLLHLMGQQLLPHKLIDGSKNNDSKLGELPASLPDVARGELIRSVLRQRIDDATTDTCRTN